MTKIISLFYKVLPPNKIHFYQRFFYNWSSKHVFSSSFVKLFASFVVFFLMLSASSKYRPWTNILHLGGKQSQKITYYKRCGLGALSFCKIQLFWAKSGWTWKICAFNRFRTLSINFMTGEMPREKKLDLNRFKC